MTPHEVMGGLSLGRNWKADPWLDDNETLEPSGPDDYKGVGDANIDRGHLAPLGSFKGTRHAWQTNYLSNITPQKKDLNRHSWKCLEGMVRKLLPKRYQNVWVITGPLYEDDPPKKLPDTDEDHLMPSGFWKIIIVKPGDNASIKVAAYIFNQDTDKDSPVSDHVTTIRKIEQRSKLNFLRLLPDDVEEELELSEDATWLEE